MHTFVARRLAPLVVAAGLLTFVTAPNATAVVPNAQAAAFVGTYTVFVDTGSGYSHTPMTLNADGTGVFIATTTWANQGKILTVTVTIFVPHTLTFTGNRTKKGICSKRQPCTTFSDGTPDGVWYAIKTS
ncbi:MAG TPA: hypothetical protein VIK61_02085 [Acidimicrobiia bacterium]